MVVRKRGRIDLKCGLVLPVGQADPLQMKFIVSIERIGNETAMEQVGLNYARNLGGMPLLDIGSVCVRDGAELPCRSGLM